jgi:hypothetical protein
MSPALAVLALFNEDHPAMYKVGTIVGAVSLLSASITLALPNEAAALPVLQPDALVAQPLPVEKTDYFYGGRNYCFYPNGWRGPGFYLCGFPYRRGFFFAPGFFHGGRGGFGGRGGRAGGGFGGGHMGGGHMGGGHMGGGHMGGHGGGHGGGHR